MTVNISKPSINIREKIAELDKPSGIAGEAVLRADSVQEIRNQIGAGRKNLLINGDMRVSQRGVYTSATALTHNAYYLDRWASMESGSTLVSTLTHSSDVFSGTTVNTQLYNVTTGATAYTGGFQRVENHAEYIGKTITLSARVKSNSSEARLLVYCSGGQGVVASSAHTGDGSWELLTITGVIASTASSLACYVSLMSAGAGGVVITAGDYIEFTQVQLELGSVATDFEHRSYGEELALCQRYYQVLIDKAAGINSSQHIGSLYNTSRAFTKVYLDGVMRAAPAITATNVSMVIYTNNSSFTSSSLDSTYIYKGAVGLDFGGTYTSSSGNACHIDSLNSTKIVADAEL